MQSLENLDKMKQFWLDYLVISDSNINLCDADFDSIEQDLEVLKILKGLFITRPGHHFDTPYYDFDNRICVDTAMSATEEEIQKVKNWLQKEER